MKRLTWDPFPLSEASRAQRCELPCGAIAIVDDSPGDGSWRARVSHSLATIVPPARGNPRFSSARAAKSWVRAVNDVFLTGLERA